MDVQADQLFYKRSSPRVYSNQIPAPQAILKLLDAAHWAASSYNEQPWRFIIGIKGHAELDKAFRQIADCLNEFNREWAGEAPALLVAIAKKHFTRNGKVNRHAWHDVGLAMGNLSIQATMDGIRLHQMAGFSPERVISTFELADEFDPVTITAIGYSKEEKPDRKRKEMEDLVFNWSSIAG